MLSLVRKVLVIGLSLIALVLVALTAWRPFPAQGLAWSRQQGRLVVVGASPLWLPRWRYREAGRPPLRVVLEAVASEGSRVDVVVQLALPPGRYLLAPAESWTDGLIALVGAETRREVARVPLACLADLNGNGCHLPVVHQLAALVAGRLGVPGENVTVELAADPLAVAAARRAELAATTALGKRRVVVVGLDGGDWELLEPLVRRGMMPNLARLMASGTYGSLQSIVPLLSPLIWTTIATGISPDEHGVLDFLEVDPQSGERIPVTSRQRRVPALWNIASAVGLSTVVAGWWATWPAELVNGVMISDRLFYLLANTVAGEPPGTVVFPAELEAEMRALAWRAERETDEGVVRSLMPVSSEAFQAALAAGRGMADPIDGFRRILVGTRTYFGATLAALRPSTNLVMVYCIGTDEVGHLLAPYLPPLLPGRDAAFGAVAAAAVERYHAVVDRWLGRLIEACPLSDCAFLVVSDHGFKWGSDRPRELSGVAAATAAMWHRPEGIFVAAGRGVDKLGRVSHLPSVFDVAPTVAALLDIPAGESWRGRPLPGCPPVRRPPVDWVALVPGESYRPTGGSGARPAAEAIAQLKALGYLEGGEGERRDGTVTEGSLNNLGLVHLEAKRYQEAEEAFRQAIQINPRYASPHYNLRRLYWETARFDEADTALWRAVELGLRDAPGALARAASDYEAQNLPERALAILARAAALFPRESRLVTHQLALLVRLGRCQEGLVVGRKAAAAFPSAAPIQAFYGLAAACAGEGNEARAALARSLALDPDQPMIREALAALPEDGR